MGHQHQSWWARLRQWFGLRTELAARFATMKFSVWPNPSQSPAEVLRLAQMAEADGWYGFWYADHYMSNTDTAETARGDVHECWAMLPAVAATTERIRIGSLVAPTSVHHPAVLANRAVTIDHISNGRMVLGIGAGWQINEHAAYGIDLEPPKERVSRFDEAIQVMSSLLGEDETSFDGDFYTLTGAPSDPAPVQAPLPILVGTGSPRMLRITARHAQEWNTWGDPTLVAQGVAKLETACEQVDRDPATMWKSVQALVVQTGDDNTDDMGDRVIAGSPAQLVDQIGRYEELGIDEFIVADFLFGEDEDVRLDTYRRFNEEVISQAGGQ